MDGWIDGWMDGQMDGWMDEWMDGWIFVLLDIHSCITKILSVENDEHANVLLKL